MKLFGTVPSHFTRKVHIVLEELTCPYEFVELSLTTSLDREEFADNPLMRYPVLIDGSLKIFGSDEICWYLAEVHPEKFPIWQANVKNRNRLAIINGAMDAEVSIIRAQRSGIENVNSYFCFEKDFHVIQNSLCWLEADLPSSDGYGQGELSYLDITLISFLDHLLFRQLAEDLTEFPKLSEFRQKMSKYSSVTKTRPDRVA